MRQLQVISKRGFRLYGAIVAKELELARKAQGTSDRSGRKAKDHAKWSHTTYLGRVKLARTMGEVVSHGDTIREKGRRVDVPEGFAGPLGQTPRGPDPVHQHPVRLRLAAAHCPHPERRFRCLPTRPGASRGLPDRVKSSATESVCFIPIRTRTGGWLFLQSKMPWR